MEIGNIIQYKDVLWVASKKDISAKVLILYNEAGERLELPQDYDKQCDDVLVVSNPLKEWIILNTPSKGKLITKITIPKFLNVEEKNLKFLVDWVPSVIFRQGGSFFINPKRVKLIPGLLLLTTFANGTTTRVIVPKVFGTVPQRVAAIRKTKQNCDRFTRIVDIDEEE